jgi:tRNA pseudouridine65 synthase
MTAPLTLIHDDGQLLAVDKPAGLLVHRTRLDAHEPDDLMTRLRAQCGAALWPVHRLDKGCSGVLLLARDVDTARRLGAAFAAGRVTKHYLALVRGWPADSGEIDYPLARDPEQPSAGQERRPALTRWRVLRRYEWPLASRPGHDATRCALVEVAPQSGRRHQIRRHFKQLAHPLIGDATHGKGPLNRLLATWLGVQRLWLHATCLQLVHPSSGQPLRIDAAPGPEWVGLRLEPPPALRTLDPS